MKNSTLPEFNKYKLKIPDLELNDSSICYLMGLNLGIVNTVEHYSNFFSSYSRFQKFETLSDLKSPLEGQTNYEFEKMIKYLEECESVFIEAIKDDGFSEEKAIKQWIIYANIINIDEEHRLLRITSKYHDVNKNYIDKLATSNPNFKNKIYNINKFGYNVNSKEDLKNKLQIEKNKETKSGCLPLVLIGVVLSFLFN